MRALNTALTTYDNLQRKIVLDQEMLLTATADQTLATFTIPGDGVFTIRNRKADLQAFRDKLASCLLPSMRKDGRNAGRQG